MSVDMDRSSVVRLNRDIADLRKKEADEIRREAEATKKMNRALESARKTSSTSTMAMYTREAEREAKNIEGAQTRRAQCADRIASKTKDVAKLQERIGAAEEKERKRQNTNDANQRRAYEQRQKAADQRIKELEAQIASFGSTSSPIKLHIAEGEGEVYDVFISHASEDKEEFVAGFAEKARSAGLSVWYDGFTLEWGDSLRQKIDKGLSGAYFGIVVLSTHFFAKRWPAYELDGLVQKEMSGHGRILPIWHKVTVDEVTKHSPSLAGRLALNTSIDSTDQIVAELIKMRDRIKPIN